MTDDKTGEVKFDITEKADVANDTTVSGTLKSDDDDRGANLRYGVALGKQDVESEAGRNLAFGSGSDGKPGMGEPLHQVGGKIVIEGRYGTLTIDPENNTYTYKTNENADRLGLDADGNRRPEPTSSPSTCVTSTARGRRSHFRHGHRFQRHADDYG